MFPLDLLKGEILRRACSFVHNGDILRKVFWRISALVFEHYYNIIKGRLYANHLSGVKASLYDTEQTQGRVYALRSRPFLAGLSMRKVSYRVA